MVGYSTSAMMIKRTTLNKTGLFHEDYREGETISWFAYIMEKDLKILILPEEVTKRRIHGENLSLLDKIHKNNTLIRILKKFIDHKRTTRLHMDDTWKKLLNNCDAKLCARLMSMSLAILFFKHI